MKKSNRVGRGIGGRSSRIGSWWAGLRVSANGGGVIAHAGAAALRLIADRTGLTGALSQAMGGNRNGRGHDRGRVLADMAVAMADGFDTVRRMDALAAGGVFTDMASRSTRGRVLSAEIDAGRLAAIAAARAATRARVWQLVVARHGAIPPARVPGGDLGSQIVLRVDANFIDAYSAKQGAARQRGAFGLHPLNVYCDNTGENLVCRLRSGRAGARDADDHIDVLTEAVFTQLPEQHRNNLLITIDGGGCSHKLVTWLHHLNHHGTAEGTAEGTADRPRRRVEFSIGWRMDKYTGPVVHALPAQAWTAMLGDDGQPGAPARLDVSGDGVRVGAVAEITHLLGWLHRWPPGLRIMVRRVKPLPGTTPTPLPGVMGEVQAHQPCLEGLEHTSLPGWRYEIFATNSTHPDIAWLDARHRKHARVESRIRCGKHTGAAKLPFPGFAANTAWLVQHAIADDLIAWLQLLACDGALARAEPRTLQDRVLHAPATLTRGGRRRWLNFAPGWPWTPHIMTIFGRILAIPALR